MFDVNNIAKIAKFTNEIIKKEKYGKNSHQLHRHRKTRQL